MSFCPTDDIHSLYIDNELPALYKKEYEEHITSCSKCAQKLQKYQTLQNFFISDSKQITPDSHYLEQSFERLQLKMHYSNNSKNQHINHSKNINNYTKYLIPSIAAVAAAFLIAVVLPLNLKSSLEPSNEIAQNVVTRIPSVQEVSLGSGRSVVISGNIHNTILPQMDYNAKPIEFSSTRRYQNPRKERNQHLIKNYQVFSPNIGEEDKISIRITIPSVSTTPVSTEIELPLNVLLGQN